MRKRLTVMLAVVAALVMCWSAASASLSDFRTLLQRIIDTDHPIRYAISTIITGEVTPPEEYDPASLISILRDAALEPVDLSETPDGEYAVLSFPDEGVRYQFYRGEQDSNYILRVDRDGNQELYRAKLPDEIFVSLFDLISSEAKTLTTKRGHKANLPLVVPEEGWVKDSLNGTVWMRGRAMLYVSALPEEQGYQLTIIWGVSDLEARRWLFGCDYDPDGDRLIADYVTCSNFSYDDETDKTTEDVFYESECETVFALDEDGNLAVMNCNDDLLDEMTFSRDDPTE